MFLGSVNLINSCYLVYRSHYRYPDLIGRQVPVFQQLGSWRHPTVWRHRPHSPKACRTGKTFAYKSGFQLNVVKRRSSNYLKICQWKARAKPKQLQWPITTNVNNRTNQWELEANTRNQRQARENACNQVLVAIGFGFASDWLTRVSVEWAQRNLNNFLNNSF